MLTFEDSCDEYSTDDLTMADSHFLLKWDDDVPVVSVVQLDYMRGTSGPYQVSLDNKGATLQRKAINPYLSLSSRPSPP